MYCTVRDVRNALTPKGDKTDVSTAASLDDWQIVDAINEADSIVAGFVSERYVIVEAEVDETVDDAPITVTVAPEPLRRWSRNIAAYLATLTFRRNKDLPEDDPVRLRYRLTMNLLEDVRNNQSTLQLPPVVASASQGVAVVNLYEGVLFTPSDFDLGYGGGAQRTEHARRW